MYAAQMTIGWLKVKTGLAKYNKDLAWEIIKFHILSVYSLHLN